MSKKSKAFTVRIKYKLKINVECGNFIGKVWMCGYKGYYYLILMPAELRSRLLPGLRQLNRAFVMALPDQPIEMS